MPRLRRAPLPGQADCRRTVCRNPNVATGADGRTTVTICDIGFSRSLAVNDIVIASATPLKCV